MLAILVTTFYIILTASNLTSSQSNIVFDYHDMKFLHLIINKFSCVELPSYISFYTGRTRLRSCHLDHRSLVSSKSPRSVSVQSQARTGFRNSYYYRAHLMWNLLPLSLREIIRPSIFKTKLIDYIWTDTVNSDSDISSTIENEISDTSD